MPDFKFREMQPTDTNFILNSWMLSNRHNQTDMENEDYYASSEHYIRMLLEKCSVLMFVDEADPDHIYGYVCWESYPHGHIIHYAFIKHSFRGFGIFRSFSDLMIPKDRPIYITHKPKNLPYLKSALQVAYDPFLIWR